MLHLLHCSVSRSIITVIHARNCFYVHFACLIHVFFSLLSASLLCPVNHRDLRNQIISKFGQVHYAQKTTDAERSETVKATNMPLQSSPRKDKNLIHLARVPRPIILLLPFSRMPMTSLRRLWIPLANTDIIRLHITRRIAMQVRAIRRAVLRCEVMILDSREAAVTRLPLLAHLEAVATESVAHVGGLQHAVETHGADVWVFIAWEDRTGHAGDRVPEDCFGGVGDGRRDGGGGVHSGCGYGLRVLVLWHRKVGTERLRLGLADNWRVVVLRYWDTAGS
jgi:hypothetical protein